jgi:phage terminase small subunit
MGLTARQKRFADAYLVHLNATRAAREAGYSVRSAEVSGCRLLRSAKVAAYVAEHLEAEMPASEVRVRLSQQARAEYSAYLTARGGVDLEALIADGKAHLIKGYKYNNRGDLMVEFYDAQAALVQLGRAHKLFVDRAEVTGKDGEPLDPRTEIEGILSRLVAGASAPGVPGQPDAGTTGVAAP